MLDQAQTKGVYADLYKVELTEFLQLSPGHWDVVLSADTLCYFGDLQAFMHATAQALRPHGWLVFTARHWPTRSINRSACSHTVVTPMPAPTYAPRSTPPAWQWSTSTPWCCARRAASRCTAGWWRHGGPEQRRPLRLVSELSRPPHWIRAGPYP
jgi:SAM-dependent methyltransferase